MRYQSNDKSVLRSRLETARRGLSTADRDRAGTGYVLICGDVPEIRAAAVVCCYSSFGTEPPTGPLLDWLAGRRMRILLPVLRPDLDLDWAEYTGPGGLAESRRGPREPVGPRRQMRHPPAVHEQQQDDRRADPVQGLRRPAPGRGRIERHEVPSECWRNSNRVR